MGQKNYMRRLFAHSFMPQSKFNSLKGENMVMLVLFVLYVNAALLNSECAAAAGDFSANNCYTFDEGANDLYLYSSTERVAFDLIEVYVAQ
jgi:hypothetical protein